LPLNVASSRRVQRMPLIGARWCSSRNLPLSWPREDFGMGDTRLLLRHLNKLSEQSSRDSPNNFPLTLSSPSLPSGRPLSLGSGECCRRLAVARRRRGSAA
jgi:hypothetical protein